MIMNCIRKSSITYVDYDRINDINCNRKMSKEADGLHKTATNKNELVSQQILSGINATD